MPPVIEPAFDPARDAAADHIQQQLADTDFQQRLASVRDSPVWAVLVDFLAVRREQLFSQRPTTTEELWLREGALREVHALLHHGPNLIVQYHTHQERQRQATAPATQ